MTIHKRTCPNCGKIFETPWAKKIYCTSECKYKAYKKKSAKK